MRARKATAGGWALAALSVAVAVALGGFAGIVGGAAAGVLAALAGLASPWLLGLAVSRAVAARDRARLLSSLAPPGITAGSRRPPGAVAKRGAAELLRAETCPVPFRHRAEIDQLTSWCESDSPVSARLVTGQGGTGKTRLALRLCEIMTAAGWTALWVGDDVQEARALEVVRSGLGGPTLLVVDYAEGRQELPKMLKSLPWDAPGRKVRMLMLARSSGAWWDDQVIPHVNHKAERHLKPEEIKLRLPSYFAPAERQGLIDSAVTAFAGYLKVAEDTMAPTDIQRDGGSVILVTVASALLAVLGDAGPRRGPDVVEALLRHEERYWVTSAAARRLHLDLPVLRQAVTVACLITVKGKKSACEMLRCIPELKDSPGKCRKTADWLHDLYPPGAAEGLGSPGWIGPLRPGLIAERLVTSTMEAEPDLLRCLLRKASEKQAYHALTTLARAAATWPTADELVRIGLSTSFGTLAVPAVRAMVATRTQLAGTIAALLARRPQLLADTLSRMLDQIPESSSDLAELRLAVLRRLCDATPDGTQARAAMLARLSDRLATDQPGEAADLARKVTIIYRRLAEQDPGQYQPALRNSLIELGARLEAAGRVDEAKEVRNEVAEIDRRRISVQGLLDRGGRSTGSSAEEAGSKGTHPKGPDPREPARAHSRPGASSRRHRRRIGREHPRRAAN